MRLHPSVIYKKVMLGFDVIGFVMRRYSFSPGPLVMGLVLGRWWKRR